MSTFIPYTPHPQPKKGDTLKHKWGVLYRYVKRGKHGMHGWYEVVQLTGDPAQVGQVTFVHPKDVQIIKD